jgi:hypothetical protein
MRSYEKYFQPHPSPVPLRLSSGILPAESLTAERTAVWQRKVSGVFNMGRFPGGVFGIAALVTTFSAAGAAIHHGNSSAPEDLTSIRFRYRSIAKSRLGKGGEMHTL